MIDLATLSKGLTPGRLSKSALRVVEYVERHPNAVLASSAVELAASLGVSDATVIRAIQALGYEGLPHLKSVIAAELDAGHRLPTEKVGVTVRELRDRGELPLDRVMSAYARVLETLRHAGTADGVAKASAILGDAERIALHGVGTLMILLEQTALHLGRIGIRSLLLDKSGNAFADSLLKIEKGDSLLMLAYGRVHRESLLVQREVRRHKGKVVVVTDNVSGKLAKRADCVIEIPRTEVGNMTMYGLTLMALEGIVLTLTGDDPKRSLATAKRLQTFRDEIEAPDIGDS
ncbi:MurR/RpiR family transcriptional regulator [Dongia sedimenti]|uniref:MurR/RpiR family transcriptional regulator n=1 Tax=Dongia sedimenti TaxID=3064282 RepID=A0ABU0YRQ3_9PROT|nr:MurR/RpiR family transcriptional regulator [Rhodospirillaceae bacterium R-7]